MKIPSRKDIKNTVRGVYFSMLEMWAIMAATLFFIMSVGLSRRIDSGSFDQLSATVQLLYIVFWLFCFSIPPILLIASALLHKLVIKELVKEVKEKEPDAEVVA